MPLFAGTSWLALPFLALRPPGFFLGGFCLLAASVAGVTLWRLGVALASTSFWLGWSVEADGLEQLLPPAQRHGFWCTSAATAASTLTTALTVTIAIAVPIAVPIAVSSFTLLAIFALSAVFRALAVAVTVSVSPAS